MTLPRTFILLGLALATALGGLALAQPETARPGVAAGRIQLLGADMAGNCKAGEIERAHRLADACEGRLQCSFTPEAGDPASEACARDSMALWDCGDGKTRYAALGPGGAGQSREIRLECPPPSQAQAVAVKAPPKPEPAPAEAPRPAATAAVVPPKKGQPETVNVDQIKELPQMVVRTAVTAPGALDASAAGINQERVRMVCEQFFDPMAPEVPAERLAQLHRDIWKAPDHSPNGTQQGCGPKSHPPADAFPDQ